MVSKTLRIQHFVNIPRINSQIATARDHLNRVHVFLIEKDGHIYKRNGLNESWELLKADERYQFRDVLNHPDTASRPRYSTNNLSFYN